MKTIVLSHLQRVRIVECVALQIVKFQKNREVFERMNFDGLAIACDDIIKELEGILEAVRL